MIYVERHFTARKWLSVKSCKQNILRHFHALNSSCGYTVIMFCGTIIMHYLSGGVIGKSMDEDEVEVVEVVEVEERLDWVSHQTRLNIEADYGHSGERTCEVCGYQCKVTRRHREHVKRHWVRYYCGCGFHASKPEVKKHQKKHIAPANKHFEQVFEVDRDLYKEWTHYVGLTLPNPPRKKAVALETVEDLSSMPEFVDWRFPGRLRPKLKPTKATKKKKLTRRPPPPPESMRVRIRRLQDQAAALRAAADMLDEEVALLREALLEIEDNGEPMME